MSDLQLLLKKLNAGPAQTQSFVYYDKNTGKIQKISSTNAPFEEFSILAVDNDEVNSILTGERKTEDYIVTYDVSLKQMRIKEFTYDDTHNSAATMTYKLPVIRQMHDSHFELQKIHNGTDVFVWDIKKSYSKGNYVWYKNIVYKLIQDHEKDVEFDHSKHTEILADVALSVIPSQEHNLEKPVFTPQYEGIHVDVWYDNLEHYAGQHVWHENAVYKLLKDQDANTKFTLDNALVLESKVHLLDDENKFLDFNTLLLELQVPNRKKYKGDIVLKNNKLFSISFEKIKIKKNKSIVNFYNSKNTKLIYNPWDDCFDEANLNEDSDTLISNDIKLDLKRTEDLLNGQIVLCGTNLFLIEVTKDYDIIIQQNVKLKYWNIQINPYTKKFLRTSGYRPSENLYFSITAKHDPNILYRSLEFKISDLLTELNPIIPFIYDSESSEDDVSIYTAKYFDSYAHEVI